MADVPNAPGVPALSSYAQEAAGILLTADAVAGYGAGLTPVWGLYLNGAPAVVAESVVAFGLRQSWTISKYPIERGGFESFDRVTQPYEPRLRFASGTNDGTRLALLSSLAAACADGNTKKYDVVTPDAIYSSVGVTGLDYDRKAASGAKLLLIDVMLQQVREQNGSQQAAKDPSGNPTQPGGTVQPSDVPLPTADPRKALTVT